MHEEDVQNHGRQDDQAAVNKYIEGIVRIEKTFPSLVKSMAKLAEQCRQKVQAQGVGMEAIVFEVPKWYNDGSIVFKVGTERDAKKVVNVPGVANFSNLRAMDKECPQAVELACALAFRLVAYCNQHKVYPHQVQVGPPVWGPEGVRIQITLHGKGMAQGQLKIV